MRWCLVVALVLAGCTSSELTISVGGDAADVAGHTYPIGRGLEVRIEVVHVTWEFGEPDPNEDSLSSEELDIVELTGAHQVPCLTVVSNGLCIVGEDASDFHITVETPHGRISASRPIAHDVQLAAVTTNLGGQSNKVHLRANSTTRTFLGFTDQAGGRASGRVEELALTGPVSLGENRLDLITTGPGTASIALVGHPDVAPLQIKVVDDATSRASIRSFTVDRVFSELPGGETHLDAWTEGPVGAHLFEPFDAEGFLALGGLDLDAVAGPGIEAHAWPTYDVLVCHTSEYCFLRGVLPGDAQTLETHVDVTIGAAVTRFPVTVHRGEY